MDVRVLKLGGGGTGEELMAMVYNEIRGAFG